MLFAKWHISDVEKVCLVVAKTNYWELTGSILAQNVDISLSTLDRLLKNGAVPHMIFAIVLGQFRTILEYQDAKQKQTPLPKIHPKSRAKIDKLLSRRSLPSHELLRTFIHINTMFNSSKSDAIYHLQQLVIKLSSI